MIAVIRKLGETVFSPSRRKAIEPHYYTMELQEILRPYFKNTHLSDVVVRVVVPCIDTQSQRSMIFDSETARKREEMDFFMRDVLAAICADTTYFSPVQFCNLSKTPLPLVHMSGGALRTFKAGNFYKNNAAVLLEPIARGQPHKLIVLNVSTGIISETNADIHERLKAELGMTYCRLQPNIQPECMGRPDDTSSELLARYSAAATEVLKGNEAFMRMLSRKLTS